MKEYNPKKLLDELLKNNRIKNVVNETKATEKQLIDALPILIDMDEQKDNKDTKYLTSFFINSDGEIQRHEILSTYWSKFEFLNNIKTQSLQRVDFEIEKDFIKENSRKSIVNKVKEFYDDKYEKGFYLYGNSGVGKTFLLKRIAHLLAKRGFEIGFVNVPNLVGLIKNKFNDNTGTHEILSLLKDVDYLFLDDIGAESITPWFRDEFLYTLLSERIQHEKTTFFSSNYDFENLQKIQARTIKQNFRDNDKASRILTRIKSLTNEYHIKKEIKWDK